MRLTNTLNQLLSELGALHQIPNMQLSPAGTLCIRLKNAVEINLELIKTSNKLFAYTVLADVPVDMTSRLDLFETLLALNCLELKTAGGAVSLNLQSAKVLYQKEIPLAGLNLAALDRSLHEVVTCNAMLSETLKNPPRHGNKFATARPPQRATAISAQLNMKASLGKQQ